MSKTKLITSAIAAEMLGFSPNYIRRLCSIGKIKAEKYGHSWVMSEKDISHITRKRKEKRNLTDGSSE